MRKVFGILFIIFGVFCLPSVFVPSPAAFIGRLVGWALTSVIPAYFLLRNSGKKDDSKSISNK